MINRIKAVFLPGKLCDQRLWTEVMNALSDIIDLIFVDLRSQHTLDEMLDDVYNAYEEKFILVGFSLGGYIAQEFALKYPKKILSLALIGVSADEYSDEEKLKQIKFIENAKQVGFKGLSDIAIRKFIHPSRYQDEKLVELIKDMAKKSGAEAFICQHLATMNRRSRLTDLAKVNCPTIIVASREDQAVPLALIEKMSHNMPEAELEIIDNCGHMIPLEQPEELSSILKTWIKKTYLSKKNNE